MSIYSAHVKDSCLLGLYIMEKVGMLLDIGRGVIVIDDEVIACSMIKGKQYTPIY